MTKILLAVISYVLLFSSCDNVRYVQGKALYDSNCSTCHMPDGSGVSKLYPPLDQFQKENISLDDMPCIIRYGQNKAMYSLEMAGIPDLSDIEINNIINYILNDMNGLGIEYTIDRTRSSLDKCAS